MVGVGYGGFWASRALTRGFAGVFRVGERRKSPGLKPIDSARVIQGAEAPCSLREDKGKGEEQATARAEADSSAALRNDKQRALRNDKRRGQGRRFVGERGGGLRGRERYRGPSTPPLAMKLREAPLRMTA